MGLNNLGKNNDQSFRVAQGSADILFVQHRHEITSPVSETLRVFAVQPGRPRYYLVYGYDSLRLLQTYDELDRAIELSQKSRS